MSTEIAWGHATTDAKLPAQVAKVLKQRHVGPTGVRVAGLRPSGGGEWTVFDTGPEAPFEADVADRGGIEVRMGMRPHPPRS